MDVILKNLLSLKVIHEDLVYEYINFCMNMDSVDGTGSFARHHILPVAVFPEYSSLEDNPWNLANLSNENHYIAHAMLHAAIENYSFACAWYAMNNKNFFDNEPISILGPGLYSSLIERRNLQCSEHSKGLVMAKDINTGEILRVSKSSFDSSNNLVGHTKGNGGDHFRNSVSVILETGEISRIPLGIYDSGIHKGVTSGKSVFKNPETGEKRMLDIDDALVKSGEFVGINKDNRFKNPGSKGQQIKINIYDSEDNLVFECYGDFRKTCRDHGLPMSLLTNTIKTGGRIEFDLENKRNCDITRIKNGNRYQYRGWYARKIK